MSIFDCDKKEIILSETAKKYKEILDQLIESRIEHRMAETDAEEILSSKLDELWNRAIASELDEIKNLPTRWWFQVGISTLSELDVYSISQYFVKQKPPIIKDIEKLKGKPFLGEKWEVGDAFLSLMVEELDWSAKEGPFDTINIRLVTMSNKSYEQLDNNYVFSRYTNNFPVFRKK